MSSSAKSLPRHTETEGEASSDQEQQYEPPQPQQQPYRRPAKQKQPQRRVGQLRKPELGSQALDTVTNTAGGVVGGVTDTLGDVAGTALDNGALNRQQEGGGKSDTLRLRLDLNLDVEITLKARIHGDLELALLTG